MAARLNKSNKKRKGSSLNFMSSSKKSAVEVEEAMMLDENDGIAENSSRASQKSSYLSRMIEMAQEAIDSNEENLCHLASLANLASDEQAAKELMKLGIYEKLKDHLMDKNYTIREKVAGILRNLSASGGVDICKSLVKSGIVAQSAMAVREYVMQMPSVVNNKEDENVKQMACCLRQVICLLCNLCEASEPALKSLNKEGTMLSLLSILHSMPNDKDLVLSIVQCLSTVTEENDPATETIMAMKPSVGLMIGLLDVYENSVKDLLIALTTSGVLLNILGKLDDGIRSEVIDKMLKVIMYTLDKGCLNELTEVSLNAEDHKKIDDCLNLLTCKKLCLELLANILCHEDEHEIMEISDEDGSSSEQSNIDDFPEFSEEASQLQIYLKGFLEKNKVIEKIQDCITYVDKRGFFCLKDSVDTAPLYRALARLQKSALASSGNVLDMNINCELELLSNIWSSVILLPSTKPDYDEEFWLEFTSYLRALAMAMTRKSYDEFLTNGSFEILEKWYGTTTGEQTKCNLLKIFGVAGKFFSQKEDGGPYLETIASILSQELAAKNSIVMITEALDTTFDAFGEDGLCDTILESSGLTKELRHLPAVLKAKIKSMKGLEKPHKNLVQATRLNLNRFLSYKKLR